MPKSSDPRVTLRHRIAKDIVGAAKKQVENLDAFLGEFPDSEQYHGESTRFWFRNLREAILALIAVVDNEIGTGR